MRQKIKSLGIMLMAFLCMTAFTACSASTADDSQLDSSITASLEGTASELIEAMNSMGDEEIESYIANGNEFTISALTAWRDNKEELGAFKEIKSSETVLDGELYVLTSDVAFEKADATILMNFDATGAPTYMSVEVQYGLGALLQRAGLNTIMGICIVFCMLLLLSFIISLFRFIGKAGNKKPAEPTVAAAPVAAPVVEEELVDDGELVAVIAAAIAASENTSTDSFVVRSIRRKVNNKWQRA